MCGIGGIISPGIEPSELKSRLLAMQERLRHRGPDDEGSSVDAAAGAGLVHTRLAILDLSSAGHQPMASADGRYSIVFNGEIYNFLELRRELEQAGEHFRSRSDTEVILRLYQREGAACVRRLDGMFAFAIWDAVKKSCFLARDPLGIKPLYIWRRGEAFAFASEIRTLLRAELGPKRLCPTALRQYLLFGSVQEPRTLVDEIESLPAGHTMLWKDGSGQLDRYWRLQFAADPILPRDAAALTRSALEDSVRRHFVSDVPVGIFLSGGKDSTAVVALARTAGLERVQTFCISFDDPQFNEGDLAARTAAHFGTDHHDWRMTAADGQSLLADYLDYLDQPSNDGFNTFCVSKFAHDRGLKVVLSGLGGDELFGGYPSFRQIPRMTAWHRRLAVAGPLRGLAGRLGERLSDSHKIQRLGVFLASPGQLGAAYWTMRAFFTPAEAERLVAAYSGGVTEVLGDGLFDDEPSGQPTVEDDVGYLETTRYMRNQLLKDSDVMSMAWGLELRVPLVDRKLVDAVARIPAGVRYADNKRLLVDAVPEIPAWIVSARKQGFRFPFERWIGPHWSEEFGELDRTSPVPLKTWYRRWCLLTLNHFLRTQGIAANCFPHEHARPA